MMKVGLSQLEPTIIGARWLTHLVVHSITLPISLIPASRASSRCTHNAVPSHMTCDTAEDSALDAALGLNLAHARESQTRKSDCDCDEPHDLYLRNPM